MEWDEEEGRFVSLHHPFTSPREEDVPILQKALETEDLEERKRLVHSVRARAYDLVINGYEVGWWLHPDPSQGPSGVGF
jgi:aspartyl-tRNA synthetase